ncbi:hypothetical protein [Spiroplasma ixodetis]|uniref:hypothetical protein n=1 Tax=Spiroplasma ixodetis TaxID=2141 RepID=UPI0025786B9B|nr:hypothetical protein [Spiroplasma ixodetis]
MGGEVGAFIFKNLDFDNPIALRDIKDWILSINIDKNNNVYFGAQYVDYLWVLKSGATKSEKIRGLPGQPKTSIESINFDSENNMYLGTENGLIKSIDKVNFILIKTKQNPNIPHSVNKDVLIDKNNNVYFGVFDVFDELSELYMLENGTQTPKKIFEKIKNSILWIDIDNKNTNFSPHVLVEETMKLNEFNNAFQTEQDCLKYIASLKKNKCIMCSWTSLNTSNLRRIRCLKCHQTFSILHGTIFYKSQTPLRFWFYLIFRWINTKHGITSTDVAKELGVTLKTAWRMGHEIRNRIAKQEH